jgi:hypothetical protein
MDYAMPRADVMCDIAIRKNPVPTRTNPLGAEGAGEVGCAGSLPAVMIAIMHALEPLGVRELDMPATSERVWQSIRNAGASGSVSLLRHYQTLLRVRQYGGGQQLAEREAADKRHADAGQRHAERGSA